eukprot:g5495.t1
MLAAVLSFSIAGRRSEDSSASSSSSIVASATAAGLCALLAVFWRSVSARADYGTRGKMHQAAAFDLKRVVDRIYYEWSRRREEGAESQTRRLRNRRGEEVDADEEVTEKEAGTPTSSRLQQQQQRRRHHHHHHHSHLFTHERLYLQIHNSCKSPIPLRIAQAFAVCESRLRRTAPCFGSSSKDLSARAASLHELQAVVASYKFWPARVPNPSEAADLAVTGIVASRRAVVPIA